MRKLAPAVLILTLMSWAPHSARASECEPQNGLSPCVDADALWFPAGRAYFAAISGPEAARVGTLSFGLAASLLTEPVVLKVASPDPDGREVQAVSRAFNLTPLFALGLVENLELTLVTPIGLHQAGAGVAGLDTQSAPPLSRTSVRDPRVGLAYALALKAPWLKTKLKFELKLPLGDELFFAGEDSSVAAPGLAVETNPGRFRAGLELGLRLRTAAELAGVRIGNQAFVALGARFDLLQNERLSLGLEAWMLPSLVDQPGQHADDSVTSATHIASEWLATLGSSVVPDSDVLLLLGAGGGLPLSSETRRTADGTTETEHFSGLATPAFRAVFSVRYAPK